MEQEKERNVKAVTLREDLLGCHQDLTIHWIPPSRKMKLMMMMMMMMMSRFVERVINGHQTRCWSAEQVGLQMSSERQWGESGGSQGGW